MPLEEGQMDYVICSQYFAARHLSTTLIIITDLLTPYTIHRRK